MPVYNAELYLKSAIDSVLNQTLQDFEFIIINDGSSDGSEEIILSYLSSKIKYIKNDKNRGLSFSLNKGLKVASGAYITRMDADDVCLPNRFDTQIRFLENNQNYGLCCSEITTIDENDEILVSNFYGKLPCPIEWEILWQNPIAHPSVMIRRNYITEFDLYYNEAYFPAEDYGLWCICILKFPVKRLNEMLIYYRILKNSMFHSAKLEALKKASLVTIDYAKTITGQNPPSFHSYFFYQGVDRKEMITEISIKEAKAWLETLKRSLNKKFNWCEEEIKAIDYDINLKLLKMLSHKELRGMKLLMSLFNLNFYYSLIYLFKKISRMGKELT